MKIEELFEKAGFDQRTVDSQPKFFTFVVAPDAGRPSSCPGKPHEDENNPDIMVATTTRDILFDLMRYPLHMQYDLLFAIVEEILRAKKGFIAIERKDRTFIASLTREETADLMFLHIS